MPIVDIIGRVRLALPMPFTYPPDKIATPVGAYDLKPSFVYSNFSDRTLLAKIASKMYG